MTANGALDLLDAIHVRLPAALQRLGSTAATPQPPRQQMRPSDSSTGRQKHAVAVPHISSEPAAECVCLLLASGRLLRNLGRDKMFHWGSERRPPPPDAHAG